MESGFDFRTFFHVRPGKRSNLLFWYDSWISHEPLRERFHNLFQLEAKKTCTLQDRLRFGREGLFLCFNWSRELSGNEVDEVTELSRLIFEIPWSGEEDVWRNVACILGRFSVKAIRSKLQEIKEVRLENGFVWCNWIPIKVNFLLCRLWLGRLPTIDNLIKRNICIESKECGVCRLEEETLNHVFSRCFIAVQIWEFVAQWCRITPMFFFTANDLSLLAGQVRGGRKWKKAVHLVIATTIWCLCKNRNNVMFNSKIGTIRSMKDGIRSLSFDWIRSRSSLKNINWESWSAFNL